MSNALERWFDKRQQLSPFRDFSQIQESFDRLFNEFSNWRKTNGMQEFGFSPSCEIAEEGNNYVLTFDLPGVKKDQVKVEADNDQLIVSAERKEEKKIDAKFDNGVLTVTIPKTESTKTKQVPVH